jgi:hypothetical protein
MTWTYNASGLANSQKDRVRLNIGDTDESRQQMQDEEIAYVLTQETSTTLAAAACCDMLAAKYSFQMNTENGALKVSAEKRMEHYQKLADRLRKGGDGEVPGDAVVVDATMYVGGTSKAAKDEIFQDSDAVWGSFKLGQDDHPDATVSTASGYF